MFYVKNEINNQVKKFIKEEISINDFKQFLIQHNKDLEQDMTHVTNPLFYGRRLEMENCAKKFGELKDSPYNNYYLFNRMCLYVSNEIENLENFIDNSTYKKIYEQNRKKYSKGIQSVVDFLEHKISLEKFWEIALSEKDSKALLEEAGFSTSEPMLEGAQIEQYGNLINVYNRYLVQLFEYTIKNNIEVVPSFYFMSSAIKFEKMNEKLYFNVCLNRLYAEKYIHLPFEIKNVDERIKTIENLIKTELKVKPEFKSSSHIRTIQWPIEETQQLPYMLTDFKLDSPKEIYTFKHPKTREVKVVEYVDRWQIDNTTKTNHFNTYVGDLIAFVQGGNNYTKVKDILIKYYDSFEEVGKYLSNIYPNYLWEKEIENLKENDCGKYKLFLHCEIILKERKIKANLTNVYKENYYKNKKEDKEFGLFIKFLENEISGEEFFNIFKKTPSLHRYLKYHFRGEKTEKNQDYTEYKSNTRIEHWLKEDKPFNLYKEQNIADWIRGLYRYFHFECILADDLFKRYKLIEECGLRHVDDDRMQEYLADLLSNVPMELKTQKEIKDYCKSKLNEIYICEKGQIPYWAQEPEWPYGTNGEPMVYVETKKKGELRTYIFKDKITGQLKYVEQFY